jgi:outer membrane biosynthesis protein TonB
MTSLAGRRRDSLTPAFIAALCLHVGLFAALTLFRPTLPLPLGSAVPITIVSKAPATDSRPAEQAPQTQTAQVEEPVPQAKAPTPPPLPPQPTPTPPRPTPVKTAPPLKTAPKPAPAPVKPVPTPKPIKTTPPPPPPTAAPAKDTFNLDKLQASIARATHATPQRPGNAPRGPARVETAPVARVDAGPGVSQSDLQGLVQLLERLWNPDCGVEGDAAVLVPIRFTVNDEGRVEGRITDAAHDSPANAVAYAAARRAIDAVHEAEPYAEAYRGKTFTVNFDAKKACAAR